MYAHHAPDCKLIRYSTRTESAKWGRRRCHHGIQSGLSLPKYGRPMQSGTCAALVLRRKVGCALATRLGDVATSSEWSRISVTNGKGLVFHHSSRCTPELIILARPSAWRGAQPHFSSPPPNLRPSGDWGQSLRDGHGSGVTSAHGALARLGGSNRCSRKKNPI